MNLDRLRDTMSPAQLRTIAGALTTPQIGLWSGAVSSGKTVTSLLAFLILLSRAPAGGLVVIVGKSLATIERNVIGTLQRADLFGPAAKFVHYTPGASTAVILGKTVHLVGATDVKAEGRIRGATIGLAYVDEATLVPSAFWKMLLSRLRVPNARLLATTNPDGPAHWLRQEFILRADEVGMRVWNSTLHDNPSLTAEYVDLLQRQYVGLWRRRFINGEWCLAAGAIYDAFDETVHVVDRMPEITRWLSVGVDYGTTNPFAAVAIGIGRDRRLYVTSEYRHASKLSRKLTDAEYSKAVQDWLRKIPRPGEITGADHAQARGIRPEKIYIDPSAASFSTQLWNDQVPGVANAANEVLDGIRTVSSLFALDRLRIHRSCTGLINELPGYSWDDKAAEKGEDRPIKVDDHSADALRYGLHSSAWLWRPTLRLPVLDLAA
ncbi:PBSX family phage terminase large subunit [Nocardiopsis synnemataformans]|uniref:PBSX family phage terminase large subunit n=1 Tax=Nocardiopsis synnemataformans TaxID=61305 RepID=UPI003EB82CC3